MSFIINWLYFYSCPVIRASDPGVVNKNTFAKLFVLVRTDITWLLIKIKIFLFSLLKKTIWFTTHSGCVSFGQHQDILNKCHVVYAHHAPRTVLESARAPRLRDTPTSGFKNKRAQIRSKYNSYVSYIINTRLKVRKFFNLNY